MTGQSALTLTAVSPSLSEPDLDNGVPEQSDLWSGGLTVAWNSLDIGHVLAAAQRHEMHRAGLDLPAWGEVGAAWESGPVTGPEDAAHGDAVPGGDYGDEHGDLHGEEELSAALDGRGRVLSAAALGGHMIMEPGPELAGWLSCAGPADRDEAALINSITAWRKLTSWAQAQELAAVAELARRRGVAGAVDADTPDTSAAGSGSGSAGADLGGAKGEAAGAGRDPVAELEAGFAPNEVALALTLTSGGAEYWMDLAVSLSRRLPATLTALGAGRIDLNRAKLIDQYTSTLDVDLARTVERRVLARAEHQTSGQLRASLQRAVLAADPAAAERRRKEAEKRAWVALFGDDDGTASLSGRCLPAAQAAAAWARISAMAKALSAAGAGGGMDLLRAQVYVGLLLGTLPLIPAADGQPDDPPGDHDQGGGGGGDPGGGVPAWDGTSPDNGPWGDTGQPRDEDAPPDMEPDDPEPCGPGSAWTVPGDSATGRSPPAWPPIPVPDVIPPAAGGKRPEGRAVLSVPWRTLTGLCSEPGQLSRIGPVTAGVARALASAAALDGACEWKVIVVSRSGRVLAVAKVRRPAGLGGTGVVGRITLTIPVGLLDQAAMLTGPGTLGQILGAAVTAGANALAARSSRARPGACTHEEASAAYQVPDWMRALVEARDQTCGFPTCRQPAWRCEQDHTIAYRLGGATCPCNLSPECARHHHLKHLPRWRLDQPRPGTLIWTTPARLRHTVTADPYQA